MIEIQDFYAALVESTDDAIVGKNLNSIIVTIGSTLIRLVLVVPLAFATS